MTDGRIIAIEGPDAAGKATQCERLKQKFIEAGRKAEVFSFHRYDTPVGKIIKAMLTGELSLFPPGGLDVPRPGDRAGEARMRQNIEDSATVLQALATVDKYDGAADILDLVGDGGIAICDRWWQSAVAYGQAEHLDPEWLENIHGFLPSADLNVLIEVPLHLTHERKPRPDDRFEADRKMLKEVRINYRDLWVDRHADPEEDDEWIIIDGDGSIEQVHTRIWEAGNLDDWLRED